MDGNIKINLLFSQNKSRPRQLFEVIIK
jgi:hypothetical protein